VDTVVARSRFGEAADVEVRKRRMTEGEPSGSVKGFPKQQAVVFRF
jgi:hypothetical protein